MENPPLTPPEGLDRRPNSRLDELMLRAGVSTTHLARLTGVARQFVNTMRQGRRPVPLPFAKRAAPWLACSEDDLHKDIGAPVYDRRPNQTRQLIARRFRAVRTAWWESIEAAARGLGWTVDDIAAIEAGSKPLDEAMIIHFCERTLVSADYLLRGIDEPVELHEVIRDRIERAFPDMIRPRLPPPGGETDRNPKAAAAAA